MNLKLLSFFTLGASAMPNQAIDKPDSNGRLCTTDALNNIIKANLPSGARFEDYVVRHRVSAKRVSDFGHAHCKASPWQGQDKNPYDHKHDDALEDQFSEYVEDNEFRDQWILQNGGTEKFPAGSGGFFHCLEKSGDGTWIMTKELPKCPQHNEVGAWKALGQPDSDPVCDATQRESTSTVCGNCLSFQNSQKFDLTTKILQNEMEIWNDRDYQLYDIPEYIGSASELIIQPHKTINSDITLVFSPKTTGYLYAFAEKRDDGNEDRDGNWPIELPAEGWVIMEERMQWSGLRGMVDLLIWRIKIEDVGSVTLPVSGDELVGGIILDIFACNDK